MDFDKAWQVLQNILNVGTQAAHGAGLIDRRAVGDVNEAESALVKHINALTEANQSLATELQKLQAKRPCDCDDKAHVHSTPEADAMAAEIAKAEAAVAQNMEG